MPPAGKEIHTSTQVRGLQISDIKKFTSDFEKRANTDTVILLSLLLAGKYLPLLNIAIQNRLCDLL